MTTVQTKPLGMRAYGSIPHLPGSRRGPADKGANAGQFRICCEQARDKHDVVIVQVKLDGTNVAAAKLDGQIVPLVRAGYVATQSPYEQHHLWAAWVRAHWMEFSSLLEEGEWISGEWLAQAHSTRYDLTGRSPFVAFDIWRVVKGEKVRMPYAALLTRIGGVFTTPPTVHVGGPLPIADAVALISGSLYGELDPPEGAVWRVERRGAVDFLAKYVRPGKVDGTYLGGDPIWNWRPQGGHMV